MSDGESRPGSISASLGSLLKTTVAAAHTRVELFAVELQEESIRLVELVILAGAVVALGGIAIGLITAVVVLCFSGIGRLIALGAFALFYLAGAAWAYRILSARLRSSTPFGGTLEEIRKDRECLQGKN